MCTNTKITHRIYIFFISLKTKSYSTNWTVFLDLFGGVGRGIEVWSHYVAQGGLELFSQLFKYWAYGCWIPHLPLKWIFLKWLSNQQQINNILRSSVHAPHSYCFSSKTRIPMSWHWVLIGTEWMKVKSYSVGLLGVFTWGYKRPVQSMLVSGATWTHFTFKDLLCLFLWLSVLSTEASWLLKRPLNW